MDFNIKAKAEEIFSKIKSDPDFEKKFKTDPVKAVEDVIGVDLPNDRINGVIEAVKAKLTADNVKDAATGIKDKLSGLLGGNH